MTTPHEASYTSSSSHSNSNIESNRDDVASDWIPFGVPIVSVEHMVNHMLPLGISAEAMERIKSSYVRDYVTNGRIALFPKNPSATGKKEDKAFAPIAQVFENIISTAAKELGRSANCDVSYSPNSSAWDPSINSGFKPDNGLILKKSIARPDNKHPHPLFDLVDFEEFKLHNNDESINDVSDFYIGPSHDLFRTSRMSGDLWETFPSSFTQIHVAFSRSASL